MADESELPGHLDHAQHVELRGRSREVIARRIVLLVVCVLLGLALANVFGQRPAAQAVDTPEARLAVSTPSRLRGGLIFEARIDVEARDQLRKPVLVFSPGWFEGLTINDIAPEPLGEADRNGSVVLDYGRVPAGKRLTVRIQYQVNPTAVGGRGLEVRLEDEGRLVARLHRDAVIFP